MALKESKILKESRMMTTRGRVSAWVFGVVSLASVSVGWTAPATIHFAGNVLAIDASKGNIVIGDMGPLLDDGRSEITRRSIRVTSSTEFTRVARIDGVAPSGWIGDYVATKLPRWDVKPGDFVTVTVGPERGGPQALEITIVDTSAP
jgi:hypothetical protein